VNLKPDERAAILKGEYPEIVRPHDHGCPFEAGEEIVLRTQRSLAGPVALVSVLITAKHRKNPKTWQAIYTIKDNRGLYMAKATGYTRSGNQSIDPDAPVLDEAAQKAYAAQGRLQAAQRKEDSREALKRQQRALRTELAHTLKNLGGEEAVALLARLQKDIQEARA
jgi:hypothetical protein